MPKVTYLPHNQTIEVAAGSTILEGAEDYDIGMQHDCGGCCACSTCLIDVPGDGMKALSPMESDERDTISMCAPEATKTQRLGCQTRVLGDVTIRVMNPE